MQKKTKRIIILTILLIIILAIILLILNTTKPIPQSLTEQAKAEYTTQIGEQTYDITNAVLDPANITPTVSAGMIPIKWNGTNWVITTVEDKDWYNYSKGQSAYIMLNDGYYQSELIRDMTNKELAENAVGNDALVVPNVPNNNPTIYMWIPRYAYNNQGEILYIKQGCSVAGTYTMPEIFTYETDKMDFSLAGIWVEYTPLASTSTVNTKINNMTGENNQYGFIANTIATNANNETSYKTTIETYNQYIANIVNGTTGASFPTDSTTDANAVGATSVRNTQENLPNVALATEEYPSNIKNDESRDLSLEEYPSNVGADDSVRPLITDIMNANRTILKITNTNQLEPIKAHGYYDTTEEKIIIEVTYRTNAIAKIIDKKGNILSENSTTADSGNEIIGNKTYKYIVIDNLGNIKEIMTTVSGLDIYIIENEDDLKLFRDAVNLGKTTANTKAYQIADVKMNAGKYTINEENGDVDFVEDTEQWEPIGRYGKPYRGKYDGNNHTISGIYINGTGGYVGLFGYVTDNCVIEDLKIIQSSIKGGTNVGGIVGAAVGKSNINNCGNEGQIQATEDNVGGIVGLYNPDKEFSSINIKKCYNVGKISGRNNVGGIVGNAYISKRVYKYIEECYNCGNIEGISKVGGISGRNFDIYIRCCYNTGTIGGNGGCGGISGSNYAGVDYCYNIGDIYSNNCAGGICGELNKSNSEVGYLNYCYNIGNIIGDKGSLRIGGIVGYINSSYEGHSVNATEKIIGDRYVGSICGTISGANSSCYYNNFLQINTSYPAIGDGTTLNGNDNVSHSDISSLPTIISVINGDNAFVEDTNNINNGYPILAWQAE